MVECERLPLQKSSFSLAMALEKLLDGVYITPRWEPQEEGMMSIVAHLPSVVKPRFTEPVGKSQTSEGDAC
jgi:hypothetical protein